MHIPKLNELLHEPGSQAPQQEQGQPHQAPMPNPGAPQHPVALAPPPHSQPQPQPEPHSQPEPVSGVVGGEGEYNPTYGAPPAAWPAVKLRLEVRDLGHAGARVFFACVDVAAVLADAVRTVLGALYTVQSCPRHVRSVTLYLEDMDGVAYTRGSELDDDHKEIHLSLRHVARNEARAAAEVRGVLVHELVHCFQYNARGTCPGGLIEGIADYVRLKAKLNPPHWKRGGTRWDEGYQTTAYLLEWIEDKKVGREGFVKQLNGAMREEKYTDEIFKGLTGEDIGSLWKAYKASLDSSNS